MNLLIHNIYRNIILIFVLLLALSCKRDELTYDYRPYCNVMVYFDWSEMDEVPEGASIYCYPQDGGEVTFLETNSVDSAVIRLREGVYDIIVFNREVTGFGSLSFKGISDYYSAYVRAAPTQSGWYQTKAEEFIVREPEQFAVATLEDFVVEEACVNQTYEHFIETGDELLGSSFSIKPMRATRHAKVILDVYNLYDVVDVSFARGAITNLAQGFHMMEAKNSDLVVVQLIDVDMWTRTQCTKVDVDGTVYADFSTFGTPTPSPHSKKYSVDIIGYFMELTLDMKLVNDSIYSSRLIMEIDEERSSEDTLYIVQRANTDSIHIPDVIDKNAGGFLPDVDDWYDEPDIDIEI